MPWTDAHCHLAAIADIDVKLTAARAHGVTAWIQGGVDPADWDAQLALKARFEGIRPVFGLHPWRVGEDFAKDLALLEKYVAEGVAFGEVGLDFGPKFEGAREPQLKAFRRQLEMARSARKPLVLHVVKAHEEALAALKSSPHEWGGLVHAFTGSLETAKRYWDLGYLISIGHRPVRAPLDKIPGEFLVVETDDAGPQKLVEIADRIAGARGETRVQVLDRSTKLLETLCSR